MATKIDSRKSGDKLTLFSYCHAAEFDMRYGLKGYPFSINLYNAKISDELITELESSKIVKVDFEFSYYSQPSGDSSLYVIPQFGFTIQKFTDVLGSLIQGLTLKYESEN